MRFAGTTEKKTKQEAKNSSLKVSHFNVKYPPFYWQIIKPASFMQSFILFFGLGNSKLLPKPPKARGR